MSLVGWLQRWVQWPIRTWLSQGASAFVPYKAAVPQVQHPDELLPILAQLREHYKPDAVDMSYDPRIVQFYLDVNQLHLIPYLDCDDAGYRIWAALLKIATDIAMVVLVDSLGGEDYSHAVVCFWWQGRRWAMDYTGLHDLTGTSVVEVYSRIIPDARFEQANWFFEYPFPDPRKV